MDVYLFLCKCMCKSTTPLAKLWIRWAKRDTGDLTRSSYRFAVAVEDAWTIVTFNVGSLCMRIRTAGDSILLGTRPHHRHQLHEAIFPRTFAIIASEVNSLIAPHFFFTKLCVIHVYSWAIRSFKLRVIFSTQPVQTVREGPSNSWNWNIRV